MVETTAEEYDQLMQKYLEYVELYRFFNRGSTAGVVAFSEFYWRLTYNHRYADPSMIGIGNG